MGCWDTCTWICFHDLESILMSVMQELIWVAPLILLADSPTSCHGHIGQFQLADILNRPSLLTHTKVVTLFHELGHAMHKLCSKTTYVRFYGTKVEMDFVEAPLKMLENWCWNNQVLKRISRNYIRSDKTPLDKIIKLMIEAKNLN